MYNSNANHSFNELVESQSKMLDYEYANILGKIPKIKCRLKHLAKEHEFVTLVNIQDNTDFGTIEPLTKTAADTLNNLQSVSSDTLYIEKGSSLAFDSSSLPKCIILGNSHVTIKHDSIIENAIFNNSSQINIHDAVIKHSYLSNVYIENNIHIENSVLRGELSENIRLNCTKPDWRKCHFIKVADNTVINNSCIVLNEYNRTTHNLNAQEEGNIDELLASFCKLNKLEIMESTLDHVTIAVDKNSLIAKEIIDRSNPVNTKSNTKVDDKVIDCKINKSCIKYVYSDFALDVDDVQFVPNDGLDLHDDKNEHICIDSEYNLIDFKHDNNHIHDVTFSGDPYYSENLRTNRKCLNYSHSFAKTVITWTNYKIYIKPVESKE